VSDEEEQGSGFEEAVANDDTELVDDVIDEEHKQEYYTDYEDDTWMRDLFDNDDDRSESSGAITSVDKDQSDFSSTNSPPATISPSQTDIINLNMGQVLPAPPCVADQRDPREDRRPQCTAEGEYEPTQCEAAVRQCWCVNRLGVERSGTRVRGPAGTLCVDYYTPPIRGEYRTVMTSPSEDDFMLVDQSEQTSTYRTTERDTQRDTQKDTQRDTQKDTFTDVTIQSEIDIEYPEDYQGVEEPHLPSLAILKDPIVLAGILSGAVLALLGFLVILFLIYRIPKKDKISQVFHIVPKQDHNVQYVRTVDQGHQV